ncbi:hypothetical protein [Cerasicoccus arenae]|uniref:tRNA_anti-like n=2 Tax=Cerasicoccus arenae TaxID=424488 RepID=A0A8J3GDQ0_9BACT|nr:hypothetical protein [Cerasicoccus arenae]GHB97721.1 hypothetical protein GCM10007047_11980 [Cerasicoccus arenae]
MSEINTTGEKKKKNGSLIALTTIVVVIGVLSIGVYFMTQARSGVEHVISKAEQKTQEQLAALATAKVSDLQPDGKLEELFKIGSTDTDTQRDNEAKSIAGKVVEWEMLVDEVTAHSDFYMIETAAGHNVGAFLDVYPRGKADRVKIEALKKGDSVKIRGYVSTVVMRKAVVSPAILVD